MTESERTNPEEQATPAEAEPIAAAPGIDTGAFFEQATSKPLQDAIAAMSGLLAEHTQAALPALALVAQKAGLELAANAMDMIASLRTQAAADALAPLGADRNDAARAKQARRALHKLSLSGVKPAPVAPPPAAAPEPDKIYACFASPVDGEGTRSITIARINTYGTLSMALFMLNEDLGVVDVLGAVPCSMSMWKRYLAEANEREQKLVPVELAFCQRQIETAVARNERSKTRLPDRYYMYAGLAMGTSEDRARPAELDAAAIQANADLLAKSSALFALPECNTWVLPPDDVRPHALKMIAELRREQRAQEERQAMPVTDLSQLQRQGTVINVATSALFDGARRAAFQDRLTYTADLLWRSDRIEEAQWAMAAALALAPESTLPVDQHPFLHEVTSASMLLAVQAEQMNAAAGGPGSAPAPAGEKKPEPEEYVDAEGNIRRKSGLIIPR